MTFWQQYTKYLIENAKNLFIQAHVYLLTMCIVRRITSGTLPVVTPLECVGGVIGAGVALAIIGAFQVYVDRKYEHLDD